MTPEEHDNLHEDAECYKKWARVYKDALAVADLAKEHMKRIEREHRITTDS